MSKGKGFSLEDIYSRQNINRLQSSKHVSEGDDRYVRSTLADDPFYKRIITKFGQQGIKDFVRTIQMKKIDNIYLSDTLWIYVLSGKLLSDLGGIGKGQSIELVNPQQNQILSTEKSKGTALIFTKDAYKLLEQRHESREQNRKIQIFQKLPFFTDIPHPQLKSLCKQVHEQRFQKNSIVYQQDQIASRLYIVKEGVFVMNRYSEDHKKHKAVLLLDNCNIFGEECFQYSIHSKYQSQYLCTVSCKSNEGVLFILDSDIFAKPPLNKQLSMPTNIYSMYTQRRRIAENKQFEEEQQIIKEKQGNDTIKKYYQRLYKLRKRNPTKFVERSEDLYTDVELFKKEQFISMKLKMKYQNILDKVKTMNTVTLKKIQLNTKNQPKSFTKGFVDLEKKFLLKSLEKRHNSKSFRDHGQMVMNALKNHAAEDFPKEYPKQYPKHKSEYLRTKPSRMQLYNSQKTQNINRNIHSPMGKIKSESNVYNFVNEGRLVKT